MIDAQDGEFQLQARTGLAQGNSTTATIFTAGAAKEENTSTIEVRVKKGGKVGKGYIIVQLRAESGKQNWPEIYFLVSESQFAQILFQYVWKLGRVNLFEFFEKMRDK